MTRAQWEWVFSDVAGQRMDRPLSPAFTSRYDAEAWLGEHWRRLADERVVHAQLWSDDSVVGKPVALRT
jgi:hypothetical protein